LIEEKPGEEEFKLVDELRERNIFRAARDPQGIVRPNSTEGRIKVAATIRPRICNCANKFIEGKGVSRESFTPKDNSLRRN